MANTKFRDSDGSILYRKSSGAGTDLDPRVSEFLESNSAAVLAAAQAIQAAAEILDNIVSGSEAQVDVVATAGLTDTQLRATAVPVDTELPAAAALADGAANPTTPISGAAALLYNGSTWDRVRGDTTNGLDVDVTRLPERPTKTLTTVCTTAASNGDNTIIAAPAAGNRIVVAQYSIQLEAATATTVIVKSGSTALRRALLQQYDSFGAQFEPGRELRLGTAEALVFNLSGANSVGYHVDYFTEAV